MRLLRNVVAFTLCATAVSTKIALRGSNPQAVEDAQKIVLKLHNGDKGGLKEEFRAMMRTGGQKRLQQSLTALSSLGYQPLEVQKWLADGKAAVPKQAVAAAAAGQGDGKWMVPDLQALALGLHQGNRARVQLALQDLLDRGGDAAMTNAVDGLGLDSLTVRNWLKDNKAVAPSSSEVDKVSAAAEAEFTRGQTDAEKQQSEKDAKSLKLGLEKNDRKFVKEKLVAVFRERGQAGMQHVLATVTQFGYKASEVQQWLKDPHAEQLKPTVKKGVVVAVAKSEDKTAKTAEKHEEHKNEKKAEHKEKKKAEHKKEKKEKKKEKKAEHKEEKNEEKKAEHKEEKKEEKKEHKVAESSVSAVAARVDKAKNAENANVDKVIAQQIKESIAKNDRKNIMKILAETFKSGGKKEVQAVLANIGYTAGQLQYYIKGGSLPGNKKTYTESKPVPKAAPTPAPVVKAKTVQIPSPVSAALAAKRNTADYDMTVDVSLVRRSIEHANRAAAKEVLVKVFKEGGKPRVRQILANVGYKPAQVQAWMTGGAVPQKIVPAVALATPVAPAVPASQHAEESAEDSKHEAALIQHLEKELQEVQKTDEAKQKSTESKVSELLTALDREHKLRLDDEAENKMLHKKLLVEEQEMVKQRQELEEEKKELLQAKMVQEQKNVEMQRAIGAADQKLSFAQFY